MGTMTKEEEMKELIDLAKKLKTTQEKRREVKKVWVAKTKELNDLSQDIRDIFNAASDRFIASNSLCFELGQLEDRPWGEWSKGYPMSVHKLSRLLRPYGIKPKQARLGDDVKRGYDRAQFEESWERYLPSQVVTSVTSFENQSVSYPDSRDSMGEMSRPYRAKSPVESEV